MVYCHWIYFDIFYYPNEEFPSLLDIFKEDEWGTYKIEENNQQLLLLLFQSKHLTDYHLLCGIAMLSSITIIIHTVWSSREEWRVKFQHYIFPFEGHSLVYDVPIILV